MADIKTFWPDPGMPTSTDLGGDGVTSSGTDPQVDLADGKPQACDPLWPNFPVPYFGGQEDANSVSGLPAQPNRFEPTEQPPGPPSLQDRRPGTIDQQ
jgi:hypothetical protein